MDGHNIILKQSYKQYEQLFNQGYIQVCSHFGLLWDGNDGGAFEAWGNFLMLHNSSDLL